jgi:hypothetical protein
MGQPVLLIMFSKDSHTRQTTDRQKESGIFTKRAGVKDQQELCATSCGVFGLNTVVQFNSRPQ